MKKNKNSIMIILIIIFSIGIIYSLYNIIIWKKDVDTNKKINSTIKEKNLIDNNTSKTKIEFTKLKEINQDTVGYIKVNGTNIDYVVVRGKDNSYYLNHNFYKEKNIAGWIFADYRNKIDGSDLNLIIYGHDTKDGSMFKTLSNVVEKKWQENKSNLEILFITENKEYKYKVFSTYIVEPENYYINTNFENDEYSKFINTIKERSNYDYKVKVNEKDKILTLSSCVKNGLKRVVLHAKMITE